MPFLTLRFPAGTPRGQADPPRLTLTAAGPAPVPQRRREEAENPPPTGARDADATRSWTSPSTRPSTRPEERRATNWTWKSWRGED